MSSNNSNNNNDDDDFESSPSDIPLDMKTSRALSELVTEAKDHLGKKDVAEMDWSRLEARLMSAIQKPEKAIVQESTESTKPTKPEEIAAIAPAPTATTAPIATNNVRFLRRENILRGAAIVFAAAAAFALFSRSDVGSRNTTSTQSTLSSSAPASSLRATEGSGQIRIGSGVVATPGLVVRAGDSINADGARAVFERAGKVTWLLEQDHSDEGAAGAATAGPVAHMNVKSAGESLVLGLDHGVIEAQVVPVPQGEAFAVDIATSRNLVRVAVHGTHLRVARTGNHVTVDLTEGVVSIGVPPRTGVTYGTLVTAPAHVDLDATDLGTLRIDHSLASVRTAIPLGPREALLVPPTNANGGTGNENPPALLATAATPDNNNNNNNSLVPRPKNGAGGAGAVVRSDSPQGGSKIDPPKASSLPPRDAITAGIRECATSMKSRSMSAADGVRITVSSNLKLKISPSGTVESAQFSPPLLPEIQTCAAQVIYKTKLEETGSVTIPIEFSY